MPYLFRPMTDLLQWSDTDNQIFQKKVCISSRITMENLDEEVFSQPLPQSLFKVRPKVEAWCRFFSKNSISPILLQMFPFTVQVLNEFFNPTRLLAPAMSRDKELHRFCKLYKTQFFITILNVLQFTFSAPFIIYFYVLSSEQSLSRNYSENFCRRLIMPVVRLPAVSIYSVSYLCRSDQYHGTLI